MLKRLFLLLPLLTLLLLSSCASTGPAATAPDTALVIRVIDGDTIDIEGGIRVRYIGIDTPERDEVFYREATEANRRLVEGKNVRLEKDVSDKDRYGRLLRYVWVGDRMVNVELVRLGMAEAKSYPPDVKYQDYFEQLEKEARAAGRGVWAK
ncbi:MAG: thermonuclease family protein [Chloroflexi bacterium]|nr:thermonuclease family protein [Chloroflexota bacterium]